MRTHSVAAFDPGDKDFNTLVLPCREVVIPLEEDLDCDPLQDDEIRLTSLDGSHEQILRASDQDAERQAEQALIHYRFRDVPPGYYRIAVRIAEQWVDVSTDLVVTARAAFLNGRKLAKQPPQITFDPRRDEGHPEPAPEPPRRLPRYIDLTPSFQDVEG